MQLHSSYETAGSLADTRVALDQPTQVVWTVDAHGRMQEDSPSWRAFTGQTSEELRGEGWLNAIHPDDRPAFRELWRSSVTAGRAASAQVRLKHAPTESWHHAELRAVPIGDPRRGVGGWVGMTVDLQDRKDAEEEAARFAEIVRVSEQEEKKTLTHLLHDDLQQLLYGVQLKLALANRLGENEDENELRRRLRAALELLATAIARTRQLTVDLSPPLLRGEGLWDAFDRLRVQMHDLHGLTVELRGDSDVSVEPPATAALLVQVVREILFNMVHSGSARAAVEIDSAGADARITVRDEGRASDVVEAELDTEGDAWLGLMAVRARLRERGADATVGAPEGERPRVVLTAPRA